MDAHEYFAGKRITLMGLGLLGRGVGDAHFLAECGAYLTVTDLKTQEQLHDSIEQLGAFSNVTFHLGEHRMEDFENADLVIKAAGVPLDSSYITYAIEHKVPVAMSTALFAQFAREAGATIIGVTGTRGKSTVTQMIYDALTRTREPKTVHLGGNVRGKSTLAMLPDVKAKDIVVLELDSWQLQGFGDLQMSPNISVFTTFLPDHMNYYKNDMKLYFTDKANIFAHQNGSDTFVMGEQVEPFIKEFDFEQKIHSKMIVANAGNLPVGTALKIPGEHNRYNAGLATAALQALGVRDEMIKAALESFVGVPGRLQFLKEVRGVKIYNDNNATTPDATVAALKSFGDAKNIVLITGGSDKGLDMSELLAEIPKHCKKVLLLAGTGTDRIKENLPDAQIYKDMAEATKVAFVAAEPGDILLLSPGFASFGTFKNEYDRNDQFVAAAEFLK